MCEIKLKIANLVYSKMLHLQVTYETPNQRQEVHCAYLDHMCLFQCHGCAKSKPQFLTAVPSLKLFRLMQVYGWTVHQRLNLGTLSC